MELLSGRNVLSVLDISSTGCQLENVFTSLGNSVSESLVTLKLGGNRFTTRSALACVCLSVCHSAGLSHSVCVCILGDASYKEIRFRGSSL